MDAERDHAEEAPTSTGRALLGACGFVLAFISVQVFVGGILGAAGASFSLEDVSLETAGALALVQLGCIAVAALVAMRMPAARARLGLVGGRAGLWATKAIAPAAIVVLVPSMLLALATGDPVRSRDVPVDIALALTGLAVLIAISEELWFRGFITARLADARRPWFAVLWSAVLFGVPHLAPDPAQVLNAFGVMLAVGIPFACVRVRCGSLLPLIAVHALIDTWAFVHTGTVVATGSPDLGDVAAALIAPALLAGGYLAWFARGARRDRRAAVPSA